MKTLLTFIKKEIVFTISFILAVISFALTTPSLEVLSGIDFRVLSLLFCLMAVVAGLQKLLVFKRCGNFLTSKIKKTRTMYILLVYMCFFTSMFLTNDVALITFVPFTIMLLPMIGMERQMITIIVLQTIAANLGSMLTPLGNPQNLYLYSVSGMSLLGFMSMLLPIWGASLLLVTIPTLMLKNEIISNISDSHMPSRNKKQELIYWLLFILCLLSVIRIIPYYVLFAIVTLTFVIVDRHVLFNIDYILLMTFICFFIFIFNMKQIPSVNEWLLNIMEGRTFIVGLLASQIISNVPAAILLSGFTTDYKALTYAVDIGGLGTLIASMASLISFKLYCVSKDSKPGKYFISFTLMNIIYLVLLGFLGYIILA